jgi:hypothetical protein
MTRTPAELFAEIAKADLERREPMMRAKLDPETARTFQAMTIWTPICVVAWLAFFIGLYLVTPS